MDVRCEKCSTEYELDESRLKPGGVTVKCTHCGHTFKVRKREAAPAAEVPSTMMGMPRGPSPATPAPPPAAAPAAGSAAAAGAAGAAGSAGNDRQWLIRLENGETRSCRELATLQQWILAGEVTRDALISRSGKTWKLLGDIVELGTYFTIADEAKQVRARRESGRASGVSGSPANKKGPTVEEARQTLVGVGAVSSGAMPLSELDKEDLGDNDPTTARRLAPRTAPQRPLTATDEIAARTTAPHAAGAEPVAAKAARKANPSGPAPQLPAAAKAAAPPAPAPAPAVLSSAPGHAMPAMPAGWPAGAPAAAAPPPPHAAAPSSAAGPMAGMPGPRDSMPWTGVGPGTAAPEAPSSGGPVEGPMGGRLRPTGDEPAFAGGNRGPRTPLASSQPFTGMARDSQPGMSGLAGRGFGPDDDAGPAVAPRGSRAGLWIAIASLAVIAGGFAVVWLLVLKQPSKAAAVDAGVSDAAVVETPATAPDAGVTPPTAPDAKAAVAAVDEPGAAELGANVEGRMRAAVAALADSSSKDEAATLAMRARLLTAIAQSQEDRAALLSSSEASAADKLRKKSKETVLEALPLAQRAFKAAPASASANLAMADLLRLQGKSSRELRRYLDVVAKAQPSSADLAILEGLLLVKEGKLAEARALWTKADAGEAKLEQSGDVRLRFRSAVAAMADGKAVEARSAVDTVIAAQPEHEAAKALLGRLDQAVASDDPLPPEEPDSGAGSGSSGSSGGTGISAGDSYEKLVKKGDELAEKNCRKAIPVYQAALDKQPTGVAALIGMGFCHIEIQEYASANSRFRTVLALQAKNERALWGIAELYRQQGAKAKAIDAFRAYLEAYPNSTAAKRQLEMLDVDAANKGGDKPGGDGGSKPGGDGGSAGSAGSDGGSKPTTSPETTPATPAPDPAPAPPPAQ